MGIGGEGTSTNYLESIYELDDSSLVSCLVSLRRYPELIHLVDTWDALPSTIRAGIVAAAKAAAGEKL